MVIINATRKAKNKLLHAIYTDSADPGSFGGAERLLKSVRSKGHKHITRADIQAYLKGEDTYTLHRQYRKHYTRRPIIVNAVDKQWQADLADMTELAKFNNDYRYLLTVVDCFSKFAWVVPVKKKDAPSMLEAFKQLFRKATPRKPERLHTDKGLEFFNKPVTDFLVSQHVLHFASNSDTKAAMVERFNRTLKTRMFAYFTSKNTHEFLPALEQLVNSYNKSVHRTIGMAPEAVQKKHEPAIFNRMYGFILAASPSTSMKEIQEFKKEITTPTKKQHRRTRRKQAQPLAVKSTVLLSKVKQLFEKGYLPNWTREQFVITSVKPSAGQYLYTIKDKAGEAIKGTFYRSELQPVKPKGLNTFRPIEKVVETRTTARGAKQYLVKYAGLPSKFNAWVNAAAVKNL